MQVKLNADERVADIGTGTGILAILAAKKSAREVRATDTCKAAVQTAAFNARELNGLNQIKVSLGEYFGDAKGTFDAIIANLPQEIVPPNYLAELTANQAQSVDGRGPGGNALLLKFLEIAPEFMHPDSRLYIIVNTITDYRATLERIEEYYRPRLIWAGCARTKDFVALNVDWFRNLLERKVIDIFPDQEGNWCARQFIYELRRR